ncbi:MAG: hypothetical protein M3367_03305 [Acidobacteriota bacterium]|nr:hypothetical protein [Acidobacteriota bacterium]
MSLQNENVSAFDLRAFRGHFRIAADHFENGVAQFEKLQKLFNSQNQIISKLEFEIRKLKVALADANNTQERET